MIQDYKKYLAKPVEFIDYTVVSYIFFLLPEDGYH